MKMPGFPGINEYLVTLIGSRILDADSKFEENDLVCRIGILSI